METEKYSNEATAKSQDISAEGSGLLYGVGNEVWIGVFLAIAFVVITNFLLDKYLFPTTIINNSNGNGPPSGPNQGRIRPTGSNYDCSICLDAATYAVETNCGHTFCGNCIFQYYEIAPRNEGPLATPSCPYCRQRMTVLLPFFSEDEQNDADLNAAAQRKTLYENVRAYNRLFSGEPRSLYEHIADLPMLLRHLWRYFWSGEGIQILFRLRILTLLGLAVFYVLLPFDLIPEVAFGVFGLLDDIMVFVLALMYVVVVFRNLIAQTGMGAE